ncbi:MAG TPA: hypothetical protein VJN62_11745 [Gemmatimonadales bacterium]|nr:hypothetical protein [Gemmatimonadales bacterium]
MSNTGLSGRDLSGLGAASASMGAALTTVAAGACCASAVLAPVIVAVLGASGAAWAAGLKPYTGYLLTGAFILLAGAFWMVYRPRPACDVAVEPSGFSRWFPRLVRPILWFSAALWMASLLVRWFVG